MSLPENYRYTKEHEWIVVENGVAKVGITEFAQSELGELVFVELAGVGKSLNKGDTLCVVESTKAASDVYSPISGTVTSANQALSNDPTLVNSSPYTDGWLATLEGINADEINGLLTAKEYQDFLNSK